MIQTHDMRFFSSKIKAIRKSLSYTILDVSSTTGISQSTIKQLESGKTIPRIDTLQFLSSFYKCDLLQLLCLSTKDNTMFMLFNSISDNSASGNIDALKSNLDLIKEHLFHKNFTPIEYRDLVQLRLYVEGLLISAQCIESNYVNLKMAIKKYEQALSIGNKAFNFPYFESFKYTSVEIAILFSAASIYGTMRECNLSNKILFYINEHIKQHAGFNVSYKLLISKIHYTISYNYHRLGNHNNALEYASIGIEHCVNADSHSFLPVLLARKGVALRALKSDNWQEPIKEAIVLIKILGKENLKPYFEQLLLCE